MEALIFYFSPVIGFVFMLTLIMAFVRKTSGNPLTRQHKYTLYSSCLLLITILIFINVI